MLGKPLGKTEKVIDQPVSVIWAIIENNTHLPGWVPSVRSVDPPDSIEKAGSIRQCQVDMGGQKGYIVEKCIERNDENRLVYRVEDDSLGLGKMCKNLGFSIGLQSVNAKSTKVKLETFADPANLIARILIPLVLKRSFANFRLNMITSLEQYSRKQTVMQKT